VLFVLLASLIIEPIEYPTSSLSVFDVLILSPQVLRIPNHQSGGRMEPQPTFQGLVIGFVFQGNKKTCKVEISCKQWRRCSALCEEVTPEPGVWIPADGQTKTFKVHAVIAENLRSSWREFQALHDLGENIPLLPAILASDRRLVMTTRTPVSTPIKSGTELSPLPACSTATVVKDEAAPDVILREREDADSIVVNAEMQRLPGVTKAFMTRLAKQFNPSQLHAIYTAATKPGFTLIQGPPGTGKVSDLSPFCFVTFIIRLCFYGCVFCTFVLLYFCWGCF
jgi:hypothetical protein